MPADNRITIDDEVVTIRPIQLADAEMEAEFIRRLSPQTKHYRFFGGVNELTAAEVSRLCDVDGTLCMAFVATIRRDGREVEVGVSRYAPEARSDYREMAVTIADDWQRKGLGAILAKQLIESARSNGVTRLYSIELADNAAMQALAKDLGMHASRDPCDPQQTIYSLAL